VHVAVTGVSQRADPYLVTGRDGADLADRLGHPGAGHRDVFDERPAEPLDRRQRLATSWS
jgi:hypothetical protein